MAYLPEQVFLTDRAVVLEADGVTVVFPERHHEVVQGDHSLWAGLQERGHLLGQDLDQFLLSQTQDLLIIIFYHLQIGNGIRSVTQ